MNNSKPPTEEQRIAKFLARAGVCSRRDAERLIEERRVKVDGHVLTTPATLVTEKSRVEVDNTLIQEPETTKIWCYYKPEGYVTTHKDPEGRPTVFEDVERYSLGRVISVGRLDLNSEGLLLLTNDGAFSRFAELPSTKWPRCYKVRVFGEINSKELMALEKGVTIDGIHYGSIEIDVPNQKPSLNTWLHVTLYEGKNREIRKVMTYLGLRVNRLIRLSYGPYELEDLKPHEIRKVKNVAYK
ncbi:MAG: rRNA pseudouridine synthase [Alphaproteobacteria bacterium]|nr:rRNA pseudouridine synthase [Alphaproteobacteria bacterium]